MVGRKITLPDEEWQKKLTPEQFHILREKGTERPFTGKYNKETSEGIYCCAACGTPLFDSQSKFQSSCGWPSFNSSKDDAVASHVDNTHGMTRTEVVCEACGGHLGHVFDDGPPPTGLRYCINSASIELKPRPE